MMPFRQPPRLHNANGELRKVGFELEFANVNIEESLAIIQQLYGGRLEKEHRFSQKVVDSSIGDFTVKIDLKLLNEKSYKNLFNSLNIDLKTITVGEGTLEDGVETALEKVVNKVIPYEIGTPPVPITEIDKLEKLRTALFEHHAEGTEAFITNAFATHINPELPDTEAGTILNYLKAFLLLYPWLVQKGETDIARRISSFINPFPSDYIASVLTSTYQPDLDTLIDDYHTHNPDRNRPLDMYPLFAALREEKVSQYKDLGNVKPRETFHYRLPNSLISRPEWSLAQEWNNWVYVEELAYDPAKLKQMSAQYLELRQNTFLGFENKWIKQTEQWISGQGNTV